VTSDVFDKARVDLGDHRLLDEKNREVPYALRVRRAEDRQEPLPASEFNRVRLDDRSEELSLDLGAEPVRHNEIVVATGGTNFRRRVRLEGSDTGKNWNLIDDNAQIIHIEADKQVLDVRRLRYPLSRYRYLRPRVYPDKGDADDKPAITSVTVYQTTHVPGKEE
jgi:broad specificity phosphatase PhoE